MHKTFDRMSNSSCDPSMVPRFNGTTARICGIPTSTDNATTSFISLDSCCLSQPITQNDCFSYCPYNDTLFNFYRCLNVIGNDAYTANITNPIAFCQAPIIAATTADKSKPSSAGRLDSPPSWLTITLTILLILPTLFGTVTATGCSTFNLDKSYTKSGGSIRCSDGFEGQEPFGLYLNGTAFIENKGVSFVPVPSFAIEDAMKVVQDVTPDVSYVTMAKNYTMNEELIIQPSNDGYMIFTTILQCVNGTWSGCSDQSEDGKQVEVCSVMELNDGNEVMGEFNAVMTS